MKYRLKKDLPFAKTGQEVRESLNGIQIKRNDKSSEFWITLGDKEKLIDEGWIEEVKPREFWVAPFNETQESINGKRYKQVINPTDFYGAFKVQEVL